MGAAMPPASLASSSSLGATSASSATAFSSRRCVPRMPPLRTNNGLAFENDLRALATMTASPGVPSALVPTNASAVGPVS